VRIALVVYGSLDIVSGGNLYDRKLVERLRASGHEVEVVSIANRGYVLDLASNLSPLLRRRLSDPGYDLLLEDELVHPSLAFLNRSLHDHRPSRPLVAIVHHLRSSEERPDWQNRLYRRVEKRYLASVDAFVFNSHTTRESVEELLAKKTRNVVATPGGDRLERKLTRMEIDARAREPGPLRILFVGNLIPRKGLERLVEAARSLQAYPFSLDVVGSLDMDRRYAARVRRQVEACGLADRVRFHGSLGGELLEERFRQAQLFVVPSSYEGFGIVYLEAMGLGLPVIATASGATDEIVIHESTGYLVPPGDATILARRIESFLEDRDLLARMSLQAFEAFADHPGWDESTGRIEELLVALTSKTRSPSAPTRAR
jgi:glycosyltransferase involved in cell wall biosynthesis